MNLNEYSPLAARTCPDLGSQGLNILHMDFGIMTEIGELLDIFKKELAYKKEIDIVNLGEEIADIAWYCANKLRMTQITYPGRDIKSYVPDPPLTPEKIYRTLRTYMAGGMFNGISSEGPLLYFLEVLASQYGLDFGTLLESNINKLRVRYPEKFDTEKALNRDLKAERTALEGDEIIT